MVGKMILEDIKFVIDADQIHDDCPCPEILEKYKRENLIDSEEVEKLIYLGIIMLFCDYNRSLSLFEKANLLSPDDKLLSNIYNTIKVYSN